MTGPKDQEKARTQDWKIHELHTLKNIRGEGDLWLWVLRFCRKFLNQLRVDHLCLRSLLIPDFGFQATAEKIVSSFAERSLIPVPVWQH